MSGFHPISLRRARHVRIALATGAVLLASAAVGYAQTVRQASPAARAPITLRSGKSFRPTLGDWEGTINGLPASFDLSYGQTSGAARYGLDDLVALRPTGCPAIAGHDTADVLASTVRHAARRERVARSEPVQVRRQPLGGSQRDIDAQVPGGRMHTHAELDDAPGDTPNGHRWRVDGHLQHRRQEHFPRAGHRPPGHRRDDSAGDDPVQRDGGGARHVHRSQRHRDAVPARPAGHDPIHRRGGSGHIDSDGSGCAGGPFGFSVKLKQAGK